ncbi:MAG: RtcB family protein [Acidobacteriia bacterium]|nr:RtcB family protein [Terriglobia bacterium]
MNLDRLERKSNTEWWIPPTGRMRVPGVIFATEKLVREMDDKVFEQVSNVATLPGIVKASFAMPDAHWGYGFPIGGVAAFDPEEGGIISAGGVGFDVSCGVRTLTTGLTLEDINLYKEQLAHALSRAIPAGVGSTGRLHLDEDEMTAMLRGGAQWAVHNGYGHQQDLERIEEHGRMTGAHPEHVSPQARKRMRDEVGTLGSGNHYLEVQHVAEIHDRQAAAAFGIHENDVVVSIHCGSRGLGHQIGTEFLREMAEAAPSYKIELPDRELACAPIRSPLGERYLGAMRAAINCALANRQVITHLTRQAFEELFPDAELSLLYDVSHNTCKLESHRVDGHVAELFVHRKGATRSYGPGMPELPEAYSAAGQPVLIGGTMGTASYILAGTSESEQRAFSSACHGAGRSMSRHAATRQWQGKALVAELARQGIIVKSPSLRGVAEEAPGAYKDVNAVVDATDEAGLARKVAKLLPLMVVKG